MIGKDRIMIYGPKTDGTYVVEFRTPPKDPRAEVLSERMPLVLFVPMLPADGEALAMSQGASRAPPALCQELAVGRKKTAVKFWFF